ncbi:acyl--CoA ligase [Pseudomaricurvus alkylphenolicus]|uniref:class I adenylate-forming enzyme family protein n=1 Tax=Pseudomaricurvus alkylphenolicus TaxID=1306991 RepID=UPI0014227AFE|nr:class I adenylate-forming enzyme family protein [Pseudomaricurvus alkylphenolicus]NIB44913.1 acyl--CoA ligase [Pseudomaricurvus alkylphenolicus]
MTTHVIETPSQLPLENSLPAFHRNLDDLITDNARQRPSAVAFIDAEGSVNWLQLELQVKVIAERLQAAGLNRGDRVGFLVSNSIQAYCAIFGAMRAGAVIVPFSTMLADKDIATLIDDATCRAIYVGPELMPLADQALGNLNRERRPSLLALDSEAEPVLAVATDPADANQGICSIIYSSGTTGLPKGAVHSHSARICAGLMSATGFRYGAESVSLLSTPPYTNGSWMMVLPALVTGSTVVLMKNFDLSNFFALTERHKPTHAFIVPTQFQMIVEYPEYTPSLFDSFECMITAGAPMPPTLKQQVMADAPGRLYELWGLTEVVATVITPEQMQEKADSVGRALPLSEIRLIGEDDREVNLPGTGEIVARSAYQMMGYWNRAEQNADIQWTADDGSTFMRTGDIGEIDEQGFLYIRGRVKDMIISGGINVFPVDIENVLRNHPALQDATVIGVPHQKWGETPVAYVRCNGNSNLDKQELLEWANDRLSKFQRLSDIVLFLSDFPRNTLGKVLKNELRSLYRAPDQ